MILMIEQGKRRSTERERRSLRRKLNFSWVDSRTRRGGTRRDVTPRDSNCCSTARRDILFFRLWTMRFALQRGANISGKGLRAAGQDGGALGVSLVSRHVNSSSPFPYPRLPGGFARSHPGSPSTPADGPSSVESRAHDCRRARITRVYLLCHVHATSGAPLQCDTV